MAKVDDYKFTGYGIISTGSSVKMFMGTDQQFFLGGKNNMMVGLSNAFTFGSKYDVMVGPSISMGMLPFEKWNTAGTRQLGHFVAKYDFSTNKNFAFQIAPEGSSNYVTQSKFNCEEGFQAVAGFQLVGDNLYEAYKATLTTMGKVVALSNLLSSLAVFMNTLAAPAPPTKDDKGELKGDTTRQYLAAAAAFTANVSATGVATYAAISAAIQRETSFKKWIHPQSVIDLKPTHVFLGAMGDIMKGQTSGTSLVLKDGRATLGAFDAIAGYPAYATGGKKPYKEKFNDFEDRPTTLLSIDPTSISNSATHAILIEAGDRQFLDPALNTLMKLKRASKELQEKTTKAGTEAYDNAMAVPHTNQAVQVAVAKQMRASAELLGLPLIKAAQAAEKTAEAFYLANPSLYLSAGTTTSVLSAIKAKAPNFNVIANSISLSDTDPPIRGLFVKNVPPSIELVNTPKTNEISMAAGGTTLKFGVSEIQLKLDEITIENGLGSLSVKPTGLTFKVGTVSVQITPYVQKWGSGLKIVGT